MTEDKNFRTTIRKRKNGSMEATISINSVKKYGLEPKQEITIKMKGETATVTTRRLREGSDTLEITIPKDIFEDKVSEGEIVDIEFSTGDSI